MLLLNSCDKSSKLVPSQLFEMAKLVLVIVGSTFGSEHPYHLAAHNHMCIWNCVMRSLYIWVV
jgi:hypothetical protein